MDLIPLPYGAPFSAQLRPRTTASFGAASVSEWESARLGVIPGIPPDFLAAWAPEENNALDLVLDPCD